MKEINLLSEDERLATLFGIILGDGCLSQYYTNEGRVRRVVFIIGSYKDDMKFFECFLSPLIASLVGKKINFKSREFHSSMTSGMRT